MPGVLAGCGSFLIFAAFALLLVSTISAPVFRPISLLDVYSGGERSTFGVFGYCLGGGACSNRGLGYNLPGVISNIAGTSYSNQNIVRLTRALVLHPIACGIAFLAFLVATLSERFGYLFSSLLCFLAFIVSLVAMAIDFGLFVAARNHVNNNSSAFVGGFGDGAGGIGNVSASLGNAVWMTLAATVSLFIASLVVCFGVCSSRRRDRVGNGYADGPGYNARWYQRGPKY